MNELIEVECVCGKVYMVEFDNDEDGIPKLFTGCPECGSREIKNAKRQTQRKQE